MKLLVTLMVVCASAALGQVGPVFEVASVKRVTTGANPGDIPRNMDNNPGHFAMYNVPLRYVIEWAYNLKDFEIVGPEWIKAEERYDIVARAEGPVPEDTLRLMVQALIVHRFQMKSHTEEKEISCYVLVRGKGAAKLTDAAPDGQPAISNSQTGTTFHNQPVSRFTFMLTRRLDRPVLDLTGLKGTYDFTIDLSGLGFGGNPPPAESTGPSIFAAVQTDLGLKLEGRKQSIGILVVDSVQRIPVEN